MTDKFFQKELEELDQEIADLDIQVPDEVTQKISKAIGVNLPKNKKKWKLFRITIDKRAAVPICVCMLLTGIMVFNPAAVTAVGNAIREILYSNTGKTTDIRIGENNRTKYLFEIPSDFKLTDSVVNKNVIKNTYCNAEDQNIYITVRCGNEDLEIYLDNENCTYSEEFEIEKHKAILIEKNGITTVVFQYEDDLVEVSGNLPRAEVREIAESIQE